MSTFPLKLVQTEIYTNACYMRKFIILWNVLKSSRSWGAGRVKGVPASLPINLETRVICKSQESAQETATANRPAHHRPAKQTLMLVRSLQYTGCYLCPSKLFIFFKSPMENAYWHVGVKMKWSMYIKNKCSFKWKFNLSLNKYEREILRHWKSLLYACLGLSISIKVYS